MSHKHKRWAWMKARPAGFGVLLTLISSVFAFPRGRALHRNSEGKLEAENVGYGLAVAGAIMALGALTGVIFVPVATFPLIDAEFAAFIGAILLVAGILVHASD